MYFGTRSGRKRAVPSVPKERRIRPAWIDAALDETSTKAVDLADRLEVSEVSLSRWRHGKRPLSRLTWAAILCALGLPFSWTPPSATAMRRRPTR
jgi:hypothetical protein